MTRFAGKVALVTGGASGIGAATVQILIDQGARVAIVDRDTEKGATLAGEIGEDRAIFLQCDVADAEAVADVVVATVAAFGNLDLLVNAAGTGSRPATAPDVDMATWHRTIAVNLDSVFYFCRAAVPHIRGRQGAIVNVASISGLAGDVGFNAYSASKGAVINYSRTLAIDHVADRIRVNCVSPGFIDTPLTAGVQSADLRGRWLDRVPMKRAGEPQEVAQVITFLLSDDASFVTGANVVVDGGMMAWTGQPNLLQERG